ncbi:MULTISPECIES: FxsA family protein [Methanosarcina]|uniref:Exlusion protein FxsA n=1 Tax=Methanosarcina mazei TaxID=2209 RepID=A0A0F8GC52_METMZ|nr:MULTISPECIES: FxsA family protein [Methanosarcina]KKF97992.1 exlusion protein FxsA [Methanosarcina mazei]KKG05580.1 exlusion protein FxsA [Methanosarcina mazei]KKG33365.1 exlusion protein FxsA [Methanosarcina mazei]KKG36723.1 exlusion protein FxsA [Methanosarcina mazei]KKG52554.1 exlusion protein FxsA [Methanosarcina mazei]
MFLKLFSLFLIIPVVEIYLLLKVGEIIGALNTVLIILITAGIGAYLTKSQGFRVLRQIQDATMQGYMPGNELLHGLFVLIGGFALLTPGFLTDTIGFSMLIPQIREIYVRIAKGIIRKKIQQGNIQMRMYTDFR